MSAGPLAVALKSPLDRVGVLLTGDLYSAPGADLRGASGAVLDVWLAFAVAGCLMVCGVAGNHDEVNAAQMTELGRNVALLDGDRRGFGGVDVAGVSGIVGDPRRAWRRTENHFLALLAKLTTPPPDVLLLHEGPTGDRAGQLGRPAIRGALERRAPTLTLCGHVHWAEPVAHLGDGHIVNVDARVVVFTRQRCFYARRVRISWAVGCDADPRLDRVIRGVRGEAAVPAVVDGVPVYVTAAEEHDDDSCPRPATHDCEEGLVQVWDAGGGGLLSAGVVAGAGRLVAATVGGRPVVVSRRRYSSAEGPVTVDLGTGRVTGTLPGHRGVSVCGLVVAAPTEVVSVARDGIMRVLSTVTGAVREFDTGMDGPLRVTMLRANECAVGGDDVRLWDLEHGRAVGTLATGPVQALTGWTDGSGLLVVQGRDHTVTVWDAGSGRRVFVADARPGAQVAAVISEDGRRVLAVADGEVVHLYAVEAGQPLGPPLAGPTRDCSVAADGAGRLVTMCEADETLAVWRVTSAPSPEHAPTADLRCVAVTPDGRVLAGGRDGRIDAWRLDDGRKDGTRGTLPGRVNALACTGNMVVAAGGDLHGVQDDLLHRWLDEGPDEPFPLGQGGETRQLAVAVAGDRLLALTRGCRRDVLVHDLLTGEHVHDLEGGGLTIGLAVGDLAGRPVAAITRLAPGVELWDIAAGVPIETPLSEVTKWGDLVHAVVDDRAAVLVESRHRVVVRDLTTGAPVYADPDNTGHVTALSARAGSLAVARVDGSVTVHHLLTGELTGTLTLPHAATALTWTPEGDLVIVARRALLHVLV